MEGRRKKERSPKRWSEELDLSVMQIKTGRKWWETVGHGGRFYWRAKSKTASSAWDEGEEDEEEEEMLNYVGAGGRAYLKGLTQNLCGGLKKSMEKCGGGVASSSTIATHECIAYPAIAIDRLSVIFGRCNSFHFIRLKSTKWNEKLCRDSWRISIRSIYSRLQQIEKLFLWHKLMFWDLRKWSPCSSLMATDVTN